MPGCLEHSFSLTEALQDAHRRRRQIVQAWIDLANAYGSVRHNLVQFALAWFHVPELVRRLVFNYYEKLAAMVTTRDWSTDFFAVETGLFQGCVLSTILFDCVFQLLLNLLSRLDDFGYAYGPKSNPVRTLRRAYAVTLV